MVRRSKLQAYIANRKVRISAKQRHRAFETLTKTYSGFVHAASPQIMDMYGGSPPHFHVEGMLAPCVKPSTGWTFGTLFCNILTFGLRLRHW